MTLVFMCGNCGHKFTLPPPSAETASKVATCPKCKSTDIGVLKEQAR